MPSANTPKRLVNCMRSFTSFTISWQTRRPRAAHTTGKTNITNPGPCAERSSTPGITLRQQSEGLRSTYGSLEPARIQPLLEKKRIQWSTQIPERRQAILEKVTRRVRADLPSFSTLFSTDTLDIQTGGWENTLDGLDVSSGEEDNYTPRHPPASDPRRQFPATSTSLSKRWRPN